MTNEQLVLLYQHADDKKSYYIEQLYLQNKRLITKIALRFKGYAELDDLMQEAYFAIVEAAENWNPERGLLFVSYAYTKILATLQRYIENCGNVIRIPAHQLAKIKKMHKIINRFILSNSRKPTIKELAAIMVLTEEQTTQLLQDALFLECKSSNESISVEDDSITLEDTFKDPQDKIIELEDDMQKEDLKKVLWGIVDSIPDPYQREVIHRRYENNDSFELIAEQMQITKDSVRYLEAKAFRKLRQAHIKKKLREFHVESKIYSESLKYSSYGYYKNTWTSAPEKIILLNERAEQKRATF